jgi:hypothetical protein
LTNTLIIVAGKQVELSQMVDAEDRRNQQLKE